MSVGSGVGSAWMHALTQCRGFVVRARCVNAVWRFSNGLCRCAVEDDDS